MRAATMEIDHHRQCRSARRMRRNSHEIAATQLLMGDRELMIARRERCSSRIPSGDNGTGKCDKEPERDRDRGSNH